MCKILCEVDVYVDYFHHVKWLQGKGPLSLTDIRSTSNHQIGPKTMVAKRQKKSKLVVSLHRNRMPILCVCGGGGGDRVTYIVIYHRQNCIHVRTTYQLYQQQISCSVQESIETVTVIV